MWSIFNAFGLLFVRVLCRFIPMHALTQLILQFAWSCSFVLVEIVDTIGGAEPMRRGRKAFNAAYAMVSVILFAVAIATYGSVGDNAQSWFLNSFDTPQWLLIIANLVCAPDSHKPHALHIFSQAIVLSLIPGYNLYLLPFLIMVERPMERRFPRLHPRVIKIIWRSLVVAVLAIIGALLPFFTSFTSLVYVATCAPPPRLLTLSITPQGRNGFCTFGVASRQIIACSPHPASPQWPITVYFPLEMWIKLYNPNMLTKAVLYSVSVFAFLVTLLAIVGSVESIVTSASSFTFGWS